jgi:hypothetical protein
MAVTLSLAVNKLLQADAPRYPGRGALLPVSNTFRSSYMQSKGNIMTHGLSQGSRKLKTDGFRSSLQSCNCTWNLFTTILDKMHRPLFYLKLNATLLVCLYLTGNTLRLRYEPNRLMLSVGLWPWYINIITITILGIIHSPLFYLKHNVYVTGLCLLL